MCKPGGFAFPNMGLGLTFFFEMGLGLEFFQTEFGFGFEFLIVFQRRLFES